MKIVVGISLFLIAGIVLSQEYPEGSAHRSQIEINGDIYYVAHKLVPKTEVLAASRELVANREDKVMPLVDALQLAFEVARQAYDKMGYNVLDVGVFPLGQNRYSVIRYGYSWSMLLKISAVRKDEDDRIHEYYQQIKIYDDGCPALSPRRTIGGRTES